jgi:hypothetical protein
MPHEARLLSYPLGRSYALWQAAKSALFAGANEAPGAKKTPQAAFFQ